MSMEYPGLPWAGCQGAGDYPVVRLDFHGAGSQVRTPASTDPATMFFDTGARHNYVSRALLERLGISIDPKHFRRLLRNLGGLNRALSAAQRAQMSDHFSEHELSVTISDGFSTFGGHARFRVVEDWDNSSFAAGCTHGQCANSEQEGIGFFRCGSRQGLISAAALRTLGVSAIVDGSNQTIRLTQR